jgi:hypothetical protein
MEIALLQQFNNKFMQTLYFWLDNIIACFINEFAVDTAKSNTAANQDFLKGPRGRLIQIL